LNNVGGVWTTLSSSLSGNQTLTNLTDRKMIGSDLSE
jgi:hypothetical protein